MVVAATFTVPTGAAAVLALFALIGAASFAYSTWKGNAGAAVTVLRQANEVLADRVKELEAKVKTQELAINLMRAKTDITLALVPLAERLETHEVAAGERHKATLHVLELIASKLETAV